MRRCAEESDVRDRSFYHAGVRSGVLRVSLHVRGTGRSDQRDRAAGSARVPSSSSTAVSIQAPGTSERTAADSETTMTGNTLDSPADSPIRTGPPHK